MDNQKANPLATRRIPSLMIQYAVPSVISMVVTALFNIVDQIFIGWGVGYLGNTATTVAFPFMIVGLAFALLTGNGAAALISLDLGRGSSENAKRALGSAIVTLASISLLLVAISLLFLDPLLTAFGATDAVMPYARDYASIIVASLPFSMLATAVSNTIRADGSPHYSMMCMISGAILNAVLDPVFIFVFHMGVKGAAYATLISQAVSFLLAVYYLLKRANHIRISLPDLKPQFKLILRTSALGSSSFMNQLSMVLVTVVINRSLVHYGAASPYGSEIPLAALGIVMKTNMILLSVILGISIGMQPILGFNYGAKNYVRVKETLRAGIIISGLIAAAVNLLFVAIPDAFISVFGDQDPYFIAFASLALRTFLACVFAAGIQIPCSLFFMATGRPLKAMVLQLTRSVFLLIPLVLILPMFFGLSGVLYAGPASDILALCVTSWFVLREFRNMEKNALLHDR
ncbi:MAG: MATE family efflux transporter [Oscillospiraceae bacterium]|nr:MATE family efflux transporter [Oscillospiraceae bacterium]